MKMQLAVLFACLCSCNLLTPPRGEKSAPTPQILVQPQTSNGVLTVHEWGTFTSMTGSDGNILSGMHHEEEALPAFVYGRNTEGNDSDPEEAAGMCPGRNKGIECPRTGETTLQGVTQKLETPVLYFYTDKPLDAQVDVSFPKGIISEWFPRATAYSPELGQWERIENGSMRWNVSVEPGLNRFPEVPAGHIWALARDVKSTPLRVDNEQEQYIFYRGLGAFAPPLSVEAKPGAKLTLKNRSSDSIPAAFLLYVHANGGALRPLGSIPAMGSLSDVVIPYGGKELSLDDFVAATEKEVARTLESSGLYRDEAQAMVKTWSTSYFRSPGVRILYVVPAAWTEALLPLTITPAPTALTRVLVGRMEVLSLEEEASVLNVATKAFQTQLPTKELVSQLGRFAEPKIRRAIELNRRADMAEYLADALDTAQMSR